MTDLERIKKDVVEMDSRANVCWYDTKVLTKAVRLILEELTAERKDEPTISKMEQVEGEPQKIGYCNECKWFRDKQVCGRCRSKNLYAPKDEPQTDTEIAKAIVHKMIDDAVIAEDAYPDLRQKMHDAVDEYEPQTDCAWK